MKNIEIIPANHGFDFTVYSTEKYDMDQLKLVLEREEVRADLEKMKPGFYKIEKYQEFYSCIMAYPHKEMIEVLREGVLSKLEVPQLLTSRVIFLSGKILLSGNGKSSKMALQILSPFMNIATASQKLNQENMSTLMEQAAVVKSIRFKNIPHSEADTMTLTGCLEDVYQQGQMPLREAENAVFCGTFNTPLGIRDLKFSTTGKFAIKKSKKSAITLELVEWVLSLISNS